MDYVGMMANLQATQVLNNNGQLITLFMPQTTLRELTFKSFIRKYIATYQHTLDSKLDS